MTVLEDFSNDSEKFEYYQSRQRIQLAELSVEAENRQIREDYKQAITELDETSTKLTTLAKTLIATNTMTVEQIAAATGMSVSAVQKLIEHT